MEDEHSIISFENGPFVDMDEFHFTQRAVLQVLHICGEEMKPLGTCFTIATTGTIAICLTARHVVDEVYGNITASSLSYTLDVLQDGTLSALYISNERDLESPRSFIGGTLAVTKIHLIDGLDIAVLILRIPVNRETGLPLRMPVLSLGLEILSVGDRVWGLGYRAMSWINRPGQQFEFDVNHCYSATIGFIQDVHFPCRDNVMLNFPCCLTNARFDGGMSGGPIFDSCGKVRAVICSSYATADDEQHTSFISLVAPALLMTVEAQTESGEIKPHFLFDFVETGAISAEFGIVKVYRDAAQLNMDFGSERVMTSALDS